MSDLTPELAQTPTQPPPAAQKAIASSLVISILLAALTVFTFWPVVHDDFVNLDDPDYVNNPLVQKGLTFKGIVWAFGTWHPVTWISHMLDAQFFGNGPGGPHFVNLMLHVANSV